jgi:alkylation response protein AidB-like acyl-CoA dehydrogenase
LICPRNSACGKKPFAISSRRIKPKAHDVDVTGEFNWGAVRKMGRLGLLSMNIPEEFGGANVDAVSAAIGMEELGWGCGSTALAIAAHWPAPRLVLWLAGIEGVVALVEAENKLGSLALTELAAPIFRVVSRPGRSRMERIGSSTGKWTPMHPLLNIITWYAPIAQAVPVL